jgi:hypothetical protein
MKRGASEEWNDEDASSWDLGFGTWCLVFGVWGLGLWFKVWSLGHLDNGMQTCLHEEDMPISSFIHALIDFRKKGGIGPLCTLLGSRAIPLCAKGAVRMLATITNSERTKSLPFISSCQPMCRRIGVLPPRIAHFAVRNGFFSKSIRQLVLSKSFPRGAIDF